MKIFKIENIKLEQLLVFAHDHDDAANLLARAFIFGMGHRPNADFDVVDWSPDRTHWPEPLIEWLEQGKRGIVWSVDEGAWELVSTPLEES